MTNASDPESTLPSVVADIEGKYRSSAAVLTIIFHPDTDRIGHVAACAVDSGLWSLGRASPAFSPPAELYNQGSGQPLQDPHVSRPALEFESTGTSVVVRRESGACRCQVDGRELGSTLEISSVQLNKGVVILLAHRIVLLLRNVTGSVYSQAGPDLSSELHGSSPYMGALRGQIASAASADLDVLIRGETGTGKELVAKAIHANSARSHNELVTINMSAIPSELAPAALFGSARGAYTGADVARVGYFEQAQGGTLFMDEVGDTPPQIQAQLLRVLQQREIQVVGGPVRAVDFRVVAATDASLESGSGFKSALRYRLGSCEIVLLPLREHPEDIGELLWFFLARFLRRSGAAHLLPGPGSVPIRIASWAELFHVFARYTWPGNIRQLSNYAQRVASASGEELHLPDELSKQFSTHGGQLPKQVSAKRSSRQVNEEEFMAAMKLAYFEPTGAARILNIPRTAIYRRVDQSAQLRVAGQLTESELRSAMKTCKGDIDQMALLLRVSRSALRSRVRSLAKPAD